MNAIYLSGRTEFALLLPGEWALSCERSIELDLQPAASCAAAPAPCGAAVDGEFKDIMPSLGDTCEVPVA